MSLSAGLIYDKKHDMIFGIQKTDLKTVITSVNKTGLNIVATVCDQGGQNLKSKAKKLSQFMTHLTY